MAVSAPAIALGALDEAEGPTGRAPEPYARGLDGSGGTPSRATR
ncbi:hypothetical protein [Streptomyces sp. CAU 1734]